VQSRIKMLEKMEDVETFQKRNVMRFAFAATERTVNEVLRVEGLRKAYGDHVVLRKVELQVKRGEKIGIIGRNGAGKTTLLKMIADELPSDGGTIKLGGGVKVGYYAQHHGDTLDMSASVQEIVQRANPAAPVSRVRSLLGAFMFSGDAVDKPVKVLSGGERSRVALARLLINPGNLILMDEPTNHLDLESADSLARSLATFDGTLIFVSHSRSLIRTLATRIWNVEDGAVDTYPGSLDEYLYSCSLRRKEVVVAGGKKPDVAGGKKPEVATPRGAAPTPRGAAAPVAPTPPPSRDDDKARKRREAEERQVRGKTLGPLEKRVTELEERITAIETAQAGRSAELADPAVYADDARRKKLLKDYQSDQEKLEELTPRWEAAAQELEAARAKLN
jgi:ATP-binding cassette subfamily F protein 3